MRDNIKVSLTIELEGSTLIKGKPETRKFYITKRDLNMKKYSKTNPEGKVVVRKGKYTYTPMEAKPAIKKLNLCREAYEYMTSPEAPEWVKKGEWDRMSKTQKLESHLERICLHNNGISYSYIILED